MNLTSSVSQSISPPFEDQTPLMKQYWELKSQVPDALLLFRMGDFYELFGDDAVTAANILEITLTSRDKNKPNPMPMAGVPHHSVQGYIQKLLKVGKKIAIGEQLEDAETAVKSSAKSTPKIVRREIVRVLTPAVQFDAEGAETNYLATAVRAGESRWVLACLEPSTGETLVSDPLDAESLSAELKRLSVRHYLQWESELNPAFLSLSNSILAETLPKNYLALESASDLLKRHYEIESLQTFVKIDAGVLALGMLVLYTLRTQQQDRLAHLRLPEPLQKPKTLILGPNAAQHLDLPELYDLINATQCTLGARQLKRWLMAPLRSAPEILVRQKAVQELSSGFPLVREKISTQLKQIYDLERICGRINTRLANPRDTLALGQSLAVLKNLASILLPCQSQALTEIRKGIDRLSEELTSLSNKIIQTQKEDAPLTARDGGIFKIGTTPELDRLISLTEDGQRWLVELETREREQTGIPSLKVRYNRVFGYYIEITQAHLKSVPSHYQRKQTMVGAERFFTEELKKFEEEILTAAVKQKSLEQELFQQLIEEIQKQTAPIMEAARTFGDLDAIQCLARLALQPGWCFPQIDDSLSMEIQAGRHPVVDQVKRGSFVPNDLSLSPKTRLTLLITGPNMGGKSTVMRQTALIIILGQMGAPIPAAQAQWGSVSSLYTRIGAQDAISRGQSTFMVEMSELAHILHHADDRSLIILDEIGRGTSTYDGISVAWATLEWICSRIGSRTLFATHYHELIRLSSTLPLLANAHMAVEGTKSVKQGSLRFLYELREGPTNESFGIQVAQLAGLPKTVIQRAWKILGELEKNSGGRNTNSMNQLSLFGTISAEATESPEFNPSEIPSDGFDRLELNSTHRDLRDPTLLLEMDMLEVPPGAKEMEPHPVLKELQSLNVNELTPLQALNLLSSLKERSSPPFGATDTV